MNLKFFVSIIGSIAIFNLVTQADAKLLSSLLSKGSGCHSQSLFKLPKFSLSSLLCRPVGSYMSALCGSSYASEGYGGGYSSGYSSYPLMSGKLCCVQPSGGSALTAYPSYGGAISSWSSGSLVGSSYGGGGSSSSFGGSSSSYGGSSSSSLVGSSYGGSGGGDVWRNEKIRVPGEYVARANLPKSPSQQLDKSSDFGNSNFGTSLYPSYGGGKISNPSKILVTHPPASKVVTPSEVIQQQLIQY